MRTLLTLLIGIFALCLPCAGNSAELGIGAGAMLGPQSSQAICPDSGRRIAVARMGAFPLALDLRLGGIVLGSARVVVTAYSAGGDEEWSLVVAEAQAWSEPFVLCNAAGDIWLAFSGPEATAADGALPSTVNTNIYVWRLTQAGEIRRVVQFGGARADELQAGDLAPDGSLVLAGMTESADFPASKGAFRPKEPPSPQAPG